MTYPRFVNHHLNMQIGLLRHLATSRAFLERASATSPWTVLPWLKQCNRSFTIPHFTGKLAHINLPFYSKPQTSFLTVWIISYWLQDEYRDLYFILYLSLLSGIQIYLWSSLPRLFITAYSFWLSPVWLLGWKSLTMIPSCRIFSINFSRCSSRLSNFSAMLKTNTHGEEINLKKKKNRVVKQEKNQGLFELPGVPLSDSVRANPGPELWVVLVTATGLT